MYTVSLAEAKARLSEFVARAEAGEAIGSVGGANR
jgi:antitoxin (DNA-binding transcriptional repressor) of toxin-antitoxin stability system